jgi:anthranilate phosphoribosyltransferase
MKALGVNVDASPSLQTKCLSEIGVCFSLASAHHPAARHAAGARKSLGIPTIFNMIGPLANPAGAERQVMGTWSQTNARLLAEALSRLGAERAMVFCSRDGLDELTTTDVNVVNEIDAHGVRSFDFDARGVGLARAAVPALQVDSLDAASHIAREVLSGRGGACRDVSLLNAAAGLWIADAAPSIEQGLRMAAAAVDSGAAATTLSRLVELSNQPAA